MNIFCRFWSCLWSEVVSALASHVEALQSPSCMDMWLFSEAVEEGLLQPLVCRQIKEHIGTNVMFSRCLYRHEKTLSTCLSRGRVPPPPKKVIVNHKGTWQFKVIRRASRVSQKVFSWFRLFICGYFLDPYSWILNCKLSSSCFLFSIVTYSHFLPKVAMYACFNESIFHLFISLI